ncbi:uncharacterized protein LOC129339053 [Eublepharis macularius]|uniref:Uncharacterized protein LOC129339053 n=1 Tax=Eublepharis macularius TaxID=481883 RepID=A0AA97LB29_EUBMA|nr:uncharacterized protein LOC129339053 [Eublepharis macularius]
MFRSYSRYIARSNRAAARFLYQRRRIRRRLGVIASRHRRRILAGGNVQAVQWCALAELDDPRDFWVYPRSSHWWDRIVLQVWDDHEWICRFRMSRSTFGELVAALRPRLERQHTTMREAISVEKRVAVAVWFLASGSSYQVASDIFGVGRSTVAHLVVEFCLAVELELLSKTVRLGPHVGRIMDGFLKLGMPHCIGAIDGTHIPICSPGGKADQYGNRKSFSSILLQGTVDHRGRFIDAEIGWSGRNHDAFVFSHSAICVAMDSGSFVPGNPTICVDGVHVPPLVLADGAYPMRRWLLKPFGRYAESEAHRNFDRCLSRARNRVECAFGRLKARFRCLSHRLQAREKNVVSIVTACVVLHNLCEDRGHEILGEVGTVDPLLISRVEGQEREMLDNHLEQGKAVREVVASWIARGVRHGHNH